MALDRKVARANKLYAVRKFSVIAALNDDIDSGGTPALAARKAKSKMNDSWSKRTSNNTKGFFDQKKARAIKRGEV
jgi:hypothetical protein